jgi:hypothetical protein
VQKQQGEAMAQGEGQCRSQIELSQWGKQVAVTHFEHVERQVALAATKASLLVAASALIIGAFLRAITDFRIFETLGWNDRWSIAFAAGGLLLVLGFLLALIAIIPKSKAEEPNALYYGWIGSASLEQYRRQFLSEDAGKKLDENLLRQIWGKSKWLKRMFRFTLYSIWCTIIGALLCLLVLVVNAPRLPELGAKTPASQHEAPANNPPIMQQPNAPASMPTPEP